MVGETNEAPGNEHHVTSGCARVFGVSINTCITPAYGKKRAVKTKSAADTALLALPPPATKTVPKTILQRPPATNTTAPTSTEAPPAPLNAPASSIQQVALPAPTNTMTMMKWRILKK